MKLSEIKTASKSDLLNAAANAMLSQGNGPKFSQMLENRLLAINRELDKRNFDDFMKKDDDYFSEGHLSCWFAKMYRGKDRAEVKFQLETQHDNSREIENCEAEIERDLTDKEKEKLEKRFYKAVYNAIVWKRGIAVAWIDSIGEVNVE